MFYELELVIFPPRGVQALGLYIMVSSPGITILLRTKFIEHLSCARNGLKSYSMRIPHSTIIEIDYVISPIVQKE